MATIVGSSGGGNWNATGSWVGGVVPGSGDDVQLKSTSGNITVNVASACRSLDCTGYSGTLTVSASQTLSIGDGSGGAFKLVAGMTFTESGTGTVAFVSTSNNGGVGWAITTGGKTFGGAVTFNGVGGMWVFQDAFTGTSQGSALTLSAGTLKTNGQTVTFGGIPSPGSSVRTLDITGSTVNLIRTTSSTPWNMSGTNLTLVATGSTISYIGAAAGAMTFNGDGFTYGSVVFAGNNQNLTITGNNTFASLDIECTGARTVTLPASGTQTITTTLKLIGSGATLSLASSSAGTATTLAYSGAGYAAATISGVSASSDILLNPIPSVAPVESGPAVGVLSATTGTWYGYAAPTFTYQWQRSPDGLAWTNIPGATSSSYTLTIADCGMSVQCVVTGSNASGSATAATTATLYTFTFLPVNGASNPLLEVAIDFKNDPTNGLTTWAYVTSDIVAYSRQPVRSNEFDQPGPASASLTLRNDQAAYTPDNPAGPYYTELLKYRKVRVRAYWNGVIYNRFRGYVLDWPQTWDEYGKDQKVTLSLVDGLTPLTTYDLAGKSLASHLSGAATGIILGLGGVTASALDTGLSTIAASGTLATGSYALQRIKDIGASENGVCFADGGGTIQFHDRSHRLTSGVSGTIQGTIGDAAGEVRYVNPQPEYGDVWPIVAVTPFGGSVAQVVTDSGTASYFQQTLNFPPGGSYLVSDSSEAHNAAQYLSARYASPVTRVSSVDLIGARDPTTWPTILSLDTSDRVLFKRRFLSGGTIAGTISLSQFVEGYGDQVTVGQDWRVSTPLSPTDQQSYWALGDATYGLLGQTTRLFY